MILMNKNDIIYLVGDGDITCKPLKVYSNLVCNFLDDLSRTIMNNILAKQYPDIVTFAFWCRKSNILKLKSEHLCNYIQVGRGSVFHIAPSNVPINFAFSLVFGLLAGNSNIVRVSTKDFKQVEIVCECINKCLAKQEFQELKRYICVVRYLHNKEITDEFSMNCNCRVIWGGDSTINKIRESRISAKANEITFADRYSFAIFDEKTIESLSEEEIRKIAEKFYNDTYLMDQNACSSPHLIMWKASEKKYGRKKFWDTLNVVAQKYDLQAKKAIDKYTLAAELATKINYKLSIYSNYLYIADLDELPNELDKLRGKFGFFFEIEIKSIKEICKYINNKVQTCVVLGVDSKKIMDELIENNCSGIDRIVEVGQSMNIGVYWDGYDIVSSLSRIIIV